MRPLSTLPITNHTIVGLTLKLPFSGPKNTPGASGVEKSTYFWSERDSSQVLALRLRHPRFLISPARASQSISARRSVDAIPFLRHYCTFQCRPRTYPRQIHQGVLESCACKSGQSVVSGKPKSPLYPGPGGAVDKGWSSFMQCTRW